MKINPFVMFYLFVACAVEAPHEDSVESTDGVLVNQVGYQTSWSDASSEGPWTITTDMDYAVTVEHAYMVHYAVQLIPCPETTGLNLFGSLIQSAYAGHSGEDDISVTPVPVIEELTPREKTNLGTVSFTPTRYCQLHYLVGRADESSEGLPENIDMIGSSILVQGHWTKNDTGQSGTFDLSTHLPHGIILDLPANTPSGEISLLLSRPSATLFDQVDFESENTDDQIWQILLNAVNSTTVVSQ